MKSLIEPQAKSLTYKDIIQAHHRLDIDFDQTVALIQHWFPEHLTSAVSLWNSLEAEKLGAKPHAQT